MKEQEPSSLRPPEQESLAVRQTVEDRTETATGTDAASKGISHEKEACRKCGRVHGHKRALGMTGLKGEAQKMAKEHALDAPREDNKNRKVAWWEDYRRKDIAVLDAASRDKSQGFTVIGGKTRVYPIRVGGGKVNREIAKRLRLPKDV